MSNNYVIEGKAVKVVRESEKALLIKYEGKEVWIPKSVFKDNGVLSDFGHSILEENLTFARQRSDARREAYLEAHPELREAASERHKSMSNMDKAIERDRS